MPPCLLFVLFCLFILEKMNVALSWKDLNHISSGQLILLKSQVSSELARFD